MDWNVPWLIFLLLRSMLLCYLGPLLSRAARLNGRLTLLLLLDSYLLSSLLLYLPFSDLDRSLKFSCVIVEDIRVLWGEDVECL